MVQLITATYARTNLLKQNKKAKHKRLRKLNKSTNSKPKTKQAN